MKAHLSEDRTEVTLVGDGWEGSFPVDQIDQHIRTYSYLQGRNKFAYARHYDETVEQLRRVKAELSAP